MWCWTLSMAPVRKDRGHAAAEWLAAGQSSQATKRTGRGCKRERCSTLFRPCGCIPSRRSVGRLRHLRQTKANPDAFEICLANSNAVDLLLALGLPPAPGGGPTPLEQFANLVTAALRRHVGRRSPEIPPFCDQQKGQMTVIALGRREGYIEERLGDLAAVVQCSRTDGATHGARRPCILALNSADKKRTSHA